MTPPSGSLLFLGSLPLLAARTRRILLDPFRTHLRFIFCRAEEFRIAKKGRCRVLLLWLSGQGVNLHLQFLDQQCGSGGTFSTGAVPELCGLVRGLV